MELSGPRVSTLEASTERILRTLSLLGGSELRHPSRLDGWTRAHVAGHLARNADALGNLVHWARTGETRPMYPSSAARRQGIVSAAGQDTIALHDDIARSAERLHAALRALTPEQWARPIQWRHERAEGTARGLIMMRWVELEVHHTDLGAGYDFRDWPEEFVRNVLPRLVEEREVKGTAAAATLATFTGPGLLPMAGGGPVVEEDPTLLVAWLTGRASLNGAPTLGPWR